MTLENDDIVISGVGGSFPKARNIEELKTRLLDNEVLLETRWKYGERGCTNLIGKIATEHFDNAYFGIHRQQCTYMDPMQRLILERTFEALLDAGVNPSEVRGKRIGCFMASSVGENDNLFLESVISGFGVTGHSRAMMPNRVSYWLNLKGPSVAYDSNWIGGIEVLRLAFDAIRTGQCESVIVGTANLALNSEFQFLYTDMGLLSSDGSTKAFDAEASGYARSDGVVVLYIQKASEARRSYASIVNVGTMFNGQREGKLCDIDIDSMTQFMTDFYAKAGVDPNQVEFVEAYGCGNKETDRKEMAALEKVYCKNRKSPLLVGTIKPNTGHSEATAALFSVVKALIALETETIPATLQFSKPNPDIPALTNGSVEIVTENRKWGAEYAAVNAIGLDSYYGHILLKANPRKFSNKSSDLPKLLITSTRNEDGIKQILEMIKNKEGINDEYTALIQNLFAKPILGHLYRGYSLVGPEEIKQEFEYHLGNKREVWFVYSGMGSQWAGMASDLMKLSVFNEAIQKCHTILKPKGVDLINIISSPDKSMFDNILHSFVGIAAIQIGLTDILNSIGIVPDGIIGHSVGELGCAYADGCMTAEQMIMSAYSRGKASLEAELIQGMMAAVGMGYQQIKDKCPPSIEVACHNGPDSSTISGPTADMEVFVKDLQDQGIFARLVNVSNIAYHSRYIKPAAPTLLKYLDSILKEPKVRSAKWISTSNKEENWDTDLAKTSSAAYHTNNLLSSVLFEEGLKHIPKDSVLIEIAPHGLLQAILKRSLKSGCTNVPLTHRGSKSATEFLFTGLGKLYLAGLDMDISNLYPKTDFPVSRGTPSLANLAHWEHSEVWRTGLEDKMNSLLYGVRDIQVTLNSEEFRECVGHQLDDKIILPTSSYLNIVSNIIASISSGHKEVVFENLHLKKYLNIPKIGTVPIHAMIQKGSGAFEILSDNDIVMTGKITFPQPTDKFMLEDTEIELGEDQVQLAGNDVYSEFAHRGQKYSGLFKTMKSLTISPEGSIGMIQWNNKWPIFLEAMFQQFLLQAGERNQDIQVPKTIQKIAISQSAFPTEKTDLKVYYNNATGIISSQGIQVIGLKSIPITTDERALTYDSIEFFPLTNNTISMNLCLNAAIHLTMESFDEEGGSSTIMVTELESNTNPLLIDNTKYVLSLYKKLNPNVTSIIDTKQVLIQQAYPCLFIVNDFIREDIAQVTVACNGFLLVRTDKNISSHPQLIQVAQFNVDGSSYSILRKLQKKQPAIIHVKGDTFSIKDISRGSVSWVSELVAATSGNENVAYLISSNMPAEGLTNFIQELRSLPNMKHVRLLVNLEKRTSDIRLSDPIYQNIFKQNLVLSVFKDSQFGIFLPIPVVLKDNLSRHSVLIPNTIKNKTIHYLGANLLDETIAPNIISKNELGNIDYAATTSNGQRIMGVAKIDQETFNIEPDPILSWEIPEDWSMEDGATVPHAYTCAYYALCHKAAVKHGETVLVHGGCTPIGMACISVACTFGCTIYTTVSTDCQRAFLKKTYGFLKDHNILTSDNTSFEPLLLMSTGGKGAEVILNCLSGPLLQASVGCLADYGRFIHYGKFDLEQDNSIGMYVFLKNTSFHAVNFENILKASNEVKEQIKKYVCEGLETVSVRPLIRKVVEHQDVETVLSALKKVSNIGKILIKIDNNIVLNKFNVLKPNQFICYAKSSYLIYGGSADWWIDLAEWLILRGARRIVVSSDSKPQHTHINRRLSLLQSNFGTDIVFAPNKSHTREGAAELLSEVYFLGPIHGVFLLPNKGTLAKSSDSKHVQYIDHALRTTAPKSLFVNFISAAAGLCQLRSEAGFSAHNIQWQKDLEFTDCIQGLDDMLTYKTKNILVKNDKISETNQETAQALFKKLILLLPPSVEDLYEKSMDIPRKPDLIQLPTLGPRYIRELAPVFIIPGISGYSEIKDLAYQLLYPTYCAVLPEQYTSIHELALDLVEKIRNIWPDGPYSLIGVSWGGALTMEIARLLDQKKCSLHIYLIDGAPSTLQASLKHLGENVKDLEVNLLSRIFQNNEAALIEKLAGLPNWDSKVEFSIENYKDILEDKQKIKTALLTLKNQLVDIVNYEPSGDSISGGIHLLRPSGSSKYDSCGLLSYCKQTLQIHIVDGDHLSIIKSPDTSEHINQTLSLI